MTEKNEHLQVVEINGVKLEVDTRHAKVIHDKLKIGSPVKLLEKSDYSGPQVYQGVIVAFNMFEELPTITVAYIKADYNSAKLEFAQINSHKKSCEKWSIVPSMDDELPLNKVDLLKSFDREIEKNLAEARNVEQKKEYFLKHFDQFFVIQDEALVD